MARRGADVQVVCAGEWDTGAHHYNGYSDDVYQGLPVRRLNLNWQKASSPFKQLYDNPVVAQLMGQFLEEWRPDVVHVTSCETLSASVLRETKARRLPLVLSLTDFWFLCPRINLLTSDGDNCDGRTSGWECTKCLGRHSKAYRWPSTVLPEPGVEALLSLVSRSEVLTRQPGLRGMFGDMDERKRFLLRALEWPDVRLTASSFVSGVHHENGLRAAIDVRAYGHDLSWLRGYRGKSASPKVRFGFIGQIVWSKGLHVLLEAVERLHAEFGARFEVLIYGDTQKVPEYGRGLMQRAAGLPEVHFMGTYGHDESAAVFANIDVLVVPSLWYDFPLIMHEAFATGSPVVATNLGGMAETVVAERNGLLFDKGDARSLAAQLRRFFDEPSLLSRLCSGIAPVKTMEDEAVELAALYQHLAAGAIASTVG